MGPLKDALVERLPWLTQELGLRITRSDYDYKAMGSSFVELESDRLKIRFVRDRGAIYMEVATPGPQQRWFELGQLWVALKGDRPEPALDGWAQFFREHRPEIEEFLGPKLAETEEAVDRIHRAIRAASRGYAQTPQGRWMRRASRGNRFLVGPLGWIVAAVLLIFLIVR